MKQLTVLVPNELGIAARLTACLAERGINIDEIDIEGVEDHGIVVLSVDRYDEALRVLSEQGFRVITQDTLLVRLEDRPGALAAVAMRLKDAGIDLRSMHILRRDAACTTASLVCSDNARAAEVLRDVLVVEPPG
ncbi:MAG: ACT domain-containing protein [Prosthecobacter sp.]|uniref:ACT domain-containing protein n=1 Tax=Prosthecobacter sp. TaxID=1965333 RepID=UPI0039038EE1